MWSGNKTVCVHVVDNFIKWSVCQKCLVWKKWTVIKPLGVRGTSYWCTNSSHFLATIMHGENLSQSWDILVEEKRKQHFCFRRVCLPHYLMCLTGDTLRWRLHAALPAHCSCGHAVAYCMYRYCVSVWLWYMPATGFGVYNNHASFSSGFALKVRWQSMINPWLPCIIYTGGGRGRWYIYRKC